MYSLDGGHLPHNLFPVLCENKVKAASCSRVGRQSAVICPRCFQYSHRASVSVEPKIELCVLRREDGGMGGVRRREIALGHVTQQSIPRWVSLARAPAAT